MSNDSKRYRVIISAPIAAANDDDAFGKAAQYADSIQSGSGVVSGHIELLGETAPMSMTINRVVFGNIPVLLSQIPAHDD